MPHTFRDDFQVFDRHPELIYLDSAATTQKPRQVLQCLDDLYKNGVSNIHRGLYPIAEEITHRFEETRQIVARFIQTKNSSEIIFTKSTTESLNILASGLGKIIPSGSQIILSMAEHHANLVPWQEMAKQYGHTLAFIQLTGEGRVDLEHFSSLITPETAVVSLSLVSNVLGSSVPIEKIRQIMQEKGSTARLILDVAQAIPHFPISVQELGCDFMVFSGHKLYAPSGVGVLWGRKELLELLPPYQTGGNMINEVTLEKSTWNQVPHKFEAGTPAIEAVIALGAALEWLMGYGMEKVAAHTRELSLELHQLLSETEGVRILGEPDPISGIISFTINGIHPHDLASYLGEQHICIRAGHHCAAPLHKVLGIGSSNRISLGLYNTSQELHHTVKTISRIYKEFSDV